MSKWFLILASGFLFFSLSSIADDCTPIDLYKDTKSALRSVPIYDQGETGTCYAHAAVQLVDYWRIKNLQINTGYLDPLYAAHITSQHPEKLEAFKFEKNQVKTVFTQAKSDPSTYANFSVSTIEALNTFGGCSRDTANLAFQKYRFQNGLSNTDLVNLVETLTYNSKSVPRNIPKSLQDIVSKITFDEKVTTQTAKAGKKVYTANDALAEIFGVCSSKKITVNTPKPKFIMARDDQTIKSYYDKNLNLTNPLIGNICANMLNDDSYKGFVVPLAYSKNSNRTQFKNKTCQMHEILVVGRKKFSDNSCKYLIRNSWGTQWNAGKECACILDNGTYQDVCKVAKPKTFLGCWYNREQVIANTATITFL